MSLDLLYPHAGDHSIQNAVLAIEWAQEIEIAALQVVRDAAKAVLKTYPKVETQQTLRVNLQPGPGSVPSAESEIGGYSYSRFSNSGELEQQVQLNRQSCLMVVADYKRWRVLIDDAQNLFAAILPALPNSVLITAVGLQYVDRFVWRGNPAELKLDEVFRAESPFIARHSLQCTQTWHSHHGFFERSERPIRHNRLDNINVNIVDEPKGRAIQILTSHRALPEPAISANGALQSVIELQNELHCLSKEVFKNLLTEPLLAKIKLKGS
ncbi:TIGR04255 family protein [Aromatoleum tolulyticum]|uniref:TIGR04255 family protein n=1 Tax=Aromatoleum tolulyticum TaxID=34027 RepID=A0A1N6WE71_9RHOO|nr:TIGR04255 family protein [Aromatoleum tolulyticum]SIQ88427.1 TIGR04255 family protein [Aromatoleum tolulyticum]